MQVLSSAMPRIFTTRLMRHGWCLNLFGTLWLRDKRWATAELINHELIHTAQQREMLFIFFYLWYAIEWILRLITSLNAAKSYRQMLFEREAYANGNNLKYLKKRRHFAWLKIKQ